MPHPLFEKHQALLTQAVNAIEQRGYWAPYAESTLAYGANALEEGRVAFEAYRDAQFYLDQPGLVERGGVEMSPYGLSLNISYPKCRPDALITAAGSAMPAWIKAGPDTRAGVCCEMLARLNLHSMEMAHAVMHTTGQGLSMAFQFAGPQAQGRGLEAVACAWREMRRGPVGRSGKNRAAVIRRGAWRALIPSSRAASPCWWDAQPRLPGMAIRGYSPAWRPATR